MRKTGPGQGRLTRIYVEFRSCFPRFPFCFGDLECTEEINTITNKRNNSKFTRTLRPSSTIRTKRPQKSDFETGFVRILISSAIPTMKECFSRTGFCYDRYHDKPVRIHQSFAKVLFLIQILARFDFENSMLNLTEAISCQGPPESP